MNRFCSKKSFYLQILIILAIFLLPWYVLAAVPSWNIIPNESSLSFTGIQNNSPLTGRFKNFTGDIYFDPVDLKANHVKITINMNSVSFSYKDIEDTLKLPDWFDVKLFPSAVFEAKDFTKLDNAHYQAKGLLTIKNKSLPLIVDFTQETNVNNKVKVKGMATIKRTAFGIGSGEWASTDEVQDDVKVNFVLTVVKK